MKLKNNMKYVAVPLKIGITVLMLLLLTCFLQAAVRQIGFVLTERDSYRKSIEPEDPNLRITRADKNFLPDGSIHLVQTLRTPRHRRKYQQERIYDAKDNLLWDGLHKDRPYEYLSWAGPSSSFFVQRRLRDMQMITPEFSRTIEIPVSSEERTQEVWRYDFKLNVFVGYELGGEIIGYIGSKGFTKSKELASVFEYFSLLKSWVPQDSFSPVVLCRTNRAVYKINFEKQKVEILFESPEADIMQLRLQRWNPLWGDKSPTKQIKYRPLIYCQTDDGKHHLIMRNPQQKVTFAVSEDWRADSVKVAVTDEAIFIHHRGRESKLPKGVSRSSKAWREWWYQFNSKPQKMWTELYRLSDSGNLELVSRFEWIRPKITNMNKIELTQRIWAMVSRVSPAAYELAWYLFGDTLEQHARQGSGMTSQYAQIVRSFRPGKSVVNAVLSVLMMGLAIWHGWARRTGWGRMIFWVMLVGAFNLAGFLAYLALNHTTTIKCPVCSKSRGLEQNKCIRCGADLPKAKPRAVDLLYSR